MDAVESRRVGGGATVVAAVVVVVVMTWSGLSKTRVGGGGGGMAVDEEEEEESGAADWMDAPRADVKLSRTSPKTAVGGKAAVRWRRGDGLVLGLLLRLLLLIPLLLLLLLLHFLKEVKVGALHGVLGTPTVTECFIVAAQVLLPTRSVHEKKE